MLSKRTLALLVLSLTVALLGLPLASKQPDTGTLPSEAEPHFPRVAGRNINEVPYQLPSGFEGEYNLVLLAFARRHQSVVNTWIEPLRSLEAESPELRVYELPTLRELPQWQQRQLDNWMAAGISDPQARKTTITLYTDLSAMQAALNIRNTARVRLFLVDRNGAIYWKGEGTYSKAQFQELVATVRSLLVE